MGNVRAVGVILVPGGRIARGFGIEIILVFIFVNVYVKGAACTISGHRRFKLGAVKSNRVSRSRPGKAQGGIIVIAAALFCNIVSVGEIAHQEVAFVCGVGKSTGAKNKKRDNQRKCG